MNSVAVVYWGGTCGSFVRHVLDSLAKNNFGRMKFSPNGSAHHIQIPFSTRNPNYISYKTHEFNKIPSLMEKYKTVVAITVDSESKEQFIIRTTNVILKFSLERQENDISNQAINYALPSLLNYLGYEYKELAETIYESRFNPAFKDLMVYFAGKDLLIGDDCFFDLEKTWAAPMDERTYGGSTDGCILLPFTCFLKGDVDTFLSTIQKAYGKELTDRQANHVITTFLDYYNAQDHLLFKDPYQYYEEKKVSALNHLEELKREYDLTVRQK